ncbi:MAG: hypothetical protein ACI9SP_000729 [Arenicella sp.]|jgi:hypothetical protein
MSKTTYRKLSFLNLTAMTLRGLAALLEKWPLLLIAFLIISPITPHLLTQYSEDGTEHYCQYIGARGAVGFPQASECSLITFIHH